MQTIGRAGAWGWIVTSTSSLSAASSRLTDGCKTSAKFFLRTSVLPWMVEVYCVQVHLYFESPAMKDSLRGSPMQAWGSCVLPKQIGQEGRTPLGEPTFAWQFTNSRFV